MGCVQRWQFLCALSRTGWMLTEDHWTLDYQATASYRASRPTGTRTNCTNISRTSLNLSLELTPNFFWYFIFVIFFGKVSCFLNFYIALSYSINVSIHFLFYEKSIYYLLVLNQVHIFNYSVWLELIYDRLLLTNLNNSC